MRDFAVLYAALDATTSSARKQAVLQAYFRRAADDDAAWAAYLLAGGKPRQVVASRRVRELACAAAGLPAWLFEECYQAVGDLAETVALLLPPPSAPQERALAAWMDEVLSLRELPPEARDEALREQWQRLPAEQRLVHGKLITGGWRVGVSRQGVASALAAIASVPSTVMLERLMGYTRAQVRPTASAYRALLVPSPGVAGAGTDADGQPYPFFLAHPLPPELGAAEMGRLGTPDDWLVEWKWDGIRAQLVRRGSVALWTRGEELVTERFPELAALAPALPTGTVLDGEIVAIDGDRPQPFAALQRRIGRQRPSAAVLRQWPVALIVYDLLEWRGSDVRAQPQWQRRQWLEGLVQSVGRSTLRLSPLLASESADWATLSDWRRQARAHGAEGLMLKQRDGAYGVGRTRNVGTWWKWKANPYTVDAVLVYAQRGHGRRAGLYSDYTFALWSHPPGDVRRELVPFAKAYSGLSDAEMAQVDAIIRRTTRDSFGPVRAVEPTLVFELGFEGIARSARHKSGVAVRFPRMLRWRTDKTVQEADCLSTLLEWLDAPATTERWS
ncbi:ATP-dependent DNA ligase [Tepidimonas sp.]|uniref:ATP-dependent DNA ligase n=1 Tax=Tepidimonas sp. TaxID=2002775 RepID=UPI0028CE1077|nr:ATP-dependent DNA ligase [Tepidimonas sp.]MDT7928302.1 ATP-dependent DNA ligase [Tepidimonas sp.]